MPKESTAASLKKAIGKAAEQIGGNGFDEEFEPTIFTPKTIQDYAGPLYVRNETPTFVSFDGGNKVGVLRLSQAGTDGSVAALSPRIARHPGFSKFWRAGKVTVTNDPDMELELDKYSDHQVELERTQQFQTAQRIYNPRSQELEFPNMGIFENASK